MKTQVTTHNTFSSNRSTEIFAWIFGLLVVAFLLYSANASAFNPEFENETYVDDIPFDTEMVVYEMMMPEFNFEDEAYIEDIPFNTYKIAINAGFNRSMSVNYSSPDEVYVNDIPFSTATVVANYNYLLAVATEYLMPDEDYVDDIPFNTCMIAAESTNKNDYYACTK